MDIRGRSKKLSVNVRKKQRISSRVTMAEISSVELIECGHAGVCA